MKKLALALVASTVVAGATSANIGTGFYLGAHAGYGATTAKATGQANGAAILGSLDSGGNAANIGIHGGYGWVAGCLYYGGEIGYTFENTKINNSAQAASGSAQLKRNGYFNAALRLGYLFTPNTMGYIRLGGNWGKWNYTNNKSTLAAASNPLTGSKNRLSFAPGLGLETAVHKHVYLRVEYAYEFGPSVRGSNSNTPTTFDNIGSIRSQSGKVGLSYKF